MAMGMGMTGKLKEGSFARTKAKAKAKGRLLVLVFWVDCVMCKPCGRRRVMRPYGHYTKPPNHKNDFAADRGWCECVCAGVTVVSGVQQK